MLLNDVTLRNYGRYQALLEQYDDDGFVPLVRAGAMVRAAREAGIADALPAPFAEGDPLDLQPTREHRNTLIELATQIMQHVNAALEPVSGE